MSSGLVGGPAPADLAETSIAVSGLKDDISLLRLRNPELQTLVSKQCDLWAYVWTSGSVLADIATGLVSAHAPDEGPFTSVEIGCGSGLASLAVAKAGGHAVATDLVPDALRLLEANADHNGVPRRCAHDARRAGTLCTQRLDWNAPDAAAALRARCFAAAAPAAVLGADVLFAGSHVRPVLRLIHDVLQEGEGSSSGGGSDPPPPPLAVIVDPGRFSCDDFEDGAPAAGLRVLLRADIAGLATPIARMKLCSVFVLAREAACATWQGRAGAAAGGSGGSGTPPTSPPCSWPLLNAATAAVRQLEARGAGTGAGAATVGATGAAPRAFGYTLPSLPPPAPA